MLLLLCGSRLLVCFVEAFVHVVIVLENALLVNACNILHLELTLQQLNMGVLDGALFNQATFWTTLFGLAR